MSDAKHTSGPWFQTTVRLSPGFVDIGADDGTNIGIAYIGRHGGPVDNAEAEANARLIAAAPDMLEALRATRDLLVRLHDGCPPLTSEALDLLGVEIDRIDTLMAKAEGRA